MGRLRKDKGGTSHVVSAVETRSKPLQAHPIPKKSKPAKKSDTVLRGQVLGLGGNEEDYELVKNVDDNLTSGTSVEDPVLSKDVSKFMKQLNFEIDPQAAKGSPPPIASQAVSKKIKKNSAKKAASTPQNRQKDESKPAEEIPKVQLPTKVTINRASHFISLPVAQWHTSIPSLGLAATSVATVSPAQLSSLTSRAAELHTSDIHTFQTSSSSNSSASEANFLAKIIQSGTLSDRLSALTLLVQSSPLHNTKALETLKTMAERGKGKGGREESLKALRCIVDWWVGGGAPSRKLKYFRDQPLLHPSVTDQHLLLWYFEDWLKKYFFSILQILETLSLDPLPYVRTQSLTLIFTLLRDKPEQEQNLLRLLVNKLGDTEKSLCSRSSYHLLQLLQTHPSMKSVIVREIISLVLRPPAPLPTTSLPKGTGKHIRFTESDSKPKPKVASSATEKKGGNVHARYYATITFNQIVLSPGDRDVALKLIDVYFEMFKELLGEDVDGFEDVEEEVDEEKKKDLGVDKGGRVKEERKGKGKGKGKKRVTEVKGAAGFAEVEDAHSRLISAILTGVNRALPFAKIDAGDAGLNKHIDTLFLITHTSTFNISLQALVLIQQISASLHPSASASASTSSISQSITDRYYRTLYTSLHDTRLATSSKQAMYLNLLFKSIKADAGNVGGERMKAIVRRFVQLLGTGGSGATEFIAGGLFLLGELFSTIPGLRSMINDAEKADAETYDPRKRDPQFAHASSSPLWELTPLLNHYHPAVSLHARQLLTSQPLTATADLSQNTLSHFLDRFVYKNPKKLKTNASTTVGTTGKGRGASAMQPAASGLDASVGVKLMKGEVEDQEGRMNENDFLKRKAEDIPVDQLFFHKFFSRKSEKEKAKAAKSEKRKGGEDSDEDDEDEDDAEEEVADSDTEDKVESEHEAKLSEEDESGSDDDEAEIWKAMKATMPKAVGEDDDLMEESDDDIPSGLENFDAADMDSDSDEEDDVDVDDEDADDVLSLVEGSDNEDLLSLDGDVPDGLIEYDGSDASEEEEWGGISGGGGQKRKREETKSEKRKKLRSLPTFASYEDYAKMIEDGPEDNI